MNNPPAFPQPFIYEPDKGACGVYTSAFDVGFGGLTLRDYFAAKAMHAEMITTFSDATPKAANDFVKAASQKGHTVEQHLAFNAYKLADAMLAEREKAQP